MPALLNQGKTAIRDALKTLVTHVGVSTDTTAFAASQTSLEPNAAATTRIEAATKTDRTVNSANDAFDATITIDGTTEMTNTTIWTIGVLDGAVETDAISRTVRSQGIGVQSGDLYTLGVRITVEDNTP